MYQPPAHGPPLLRTFLTASSTRVPRHRMEELGKWGKEHVNDSWNLAKPMVDRLVSDLREDKMKSFLTGLSTGWGSSPTPKVNPSTGCPT